MQDILQQVRLWLAGVEFGALGDLVTRGGPVVVVLLALSVVALTVALLKATQFIWLGVGSNRTALQDALSCWRNGRREEAWQRLAQRRDGFSGILETAISGRMSGRNDRILREDVEQKALGYLAGLKSSLRALEAISQLAPLIGLFGTVIGMMGAFRTLQAAGADADPAALAGGIWVALITTAVGLAVAIPSAFALYWFEGRLAREQTLVEAAVTQIFVVEQDAATGVGARALTSGEFSDAAE